LVLVIIPSTISAMRGAVEELAEAGKGGSTRLSLSTLVPIVDAMRHLATFGVTNAQLHSKLAAGVAGDDGVTVTTGEDLQLRALGLMHALVMKSVPGTSSAMHHWCA
jgi:hypothetical protein